MEQKNVIYRFQQTDNIHEIFIFDESTSALDVNTEKEIMDNIRKFYPDATRIFITHRENCLELFDRVVFIENGEIFR